VLATLVKPTGGRAQVAGFDVVAEPVEVRWRIGFTMQQVGVDEFATASELVAPQGRLQGLTKRDARTRASLLLEALDLGEVADSRLGTLSGGTRRRWTWPLRSCTCHRCCSSTSRPRGSIRAAAPASGTYSTGCVATWA